MCRLAMKTASEPFNPFSVLTAMEAMQEGYDGSGLGLCLRGLKFADYKYNAGDPILSGIAHTEEALARLNKIMDDKGFVLAGSDLGADVLARERWPLRRAPLLFETSQPRVFAVGDVRANSVKRVASAVGEGSVCIQLVHQVLAE